jgi:hypothetical protein
MEEPLAHTSRVVTLVDALEQVARSGSRPYTPMAGLMLTYPNGRPRTSVSTSETANTMDQAEYDSDRGLVPST